MPREPRRVAKSYDEIVRLTVPDLDSSQRPTQLQEQQAYEGTRILSDEEQQLHTRVLDALHGARGVNQVQIEIERETVTIRGQVSEPGMLDQVEDRIRAVDGVRNVVNLMVLGSAG